MLHFFTPLNWKFDIFFRSSVLIAELSIISHAHDEELVFMDMLHLTLQDSAGQWHHTKVFM